MPNHTFHSTGPERDHRRRYRIDGAKGQEELKRALVVLDKNEEGLCLAGAELGLDMESLAEVKRMLKLLVGGHR